MEVLYKYDFGHETFGEVRKENDLYQCYETPLYGGEFMKVGEPFIKITEAIEYLHQLT